MTKAILVIDIPNEWLEYEDEKIEDLMVSYTLYSHKTIYDEAYSKPLKPLPQKLEFKTDRLTLKDNMDEIDNYIKNFGYERVGNIHDTIGGYNACIDEILGEE